MSRESIADAGAVLAFSFEVKSLVTELNAALATLFRPLGLTCVQAEAIMALDDLGPVTLKQLAAHLVAGCLDFGEVVAFGCAQGVDVFGGGGEPSSGVLAEIAGAAGLSSIALMKAAGVKHENTVIVDRDGVVYRGRANVDQWKAAHATDTPHRTLAEAMVGAGAATGGLASAGGGEPESQFYTVKKGDTLSKIAKEFYGEASKYPQIFAANKPMLKHPDKIYPGQMLRIPPEA